MTKLLQQAFDAAARLPAEEQDLLAERVLAELAADDDFDKAIDATSQKLVTLASSALAEHQAGDTQPLDQERV